MLTEWPGSGELAFLCQQTMTMTDGHDRSLYSLLMDLENWQFLCKQYTYMALYAALVMHKAHRVLYIVARDHSSYLVTEIKVETTVESGREK